MCCVLCCVVPRLALRPFSRLVDVSLSRWASFVSRLVFIAGLPLFIVGLPQIRRSVHCPSRASTGSSHCPSYRDSATPRPLVPSVAQLLTQLDASVRWEDVPISSTGSSFNTHPFVLLLTLISPLSYGGRETVFEPFERSNTPKIKMSMSKSKMSTPAVVRSAVGVHQPRPRTEGARVPAASP